MIHYKNIISLFVATSITLLFNFSEAKNKPLPRSFKLSNDGLVIPEGFAPEFPFKDTSLASTFQYRFMNSKVGIMVTNNDTSKIPTTLEDAVLHGKDAPISMIQDLHEKSYAFWSKISDAELVKPIRSYTNQSIEMATIDLQGIKDLNVKAYQLWNRLIECNNKSPEVARLSIFYSNPKTFCSGNSGGYESESLFKQFSDLGLEFQQYLMNSMPFTLISEYPNNFILFTNPHPLLMEFAVMHWSVYFNHSLEGKFDETKFLNPWSASFFEFSQFKTLVDRINLFPDNDVVTKSKPNVNSIALLFIKTVSNIVIFLTKAHFEQNNTSSSPATSTSSCSIYGLWPALNRTLLYSEIPLHYHLYSFISTREDLNSKVTLNCEKGSSLLRPKYPSNDVYSLYFNTNVTNIRARYYDFIGVHHENNTVNSSAGNSFIKGFLDAIGF